MTLSPVDCVSSRVVGGTMAPPVTIKEAAKRLGISERTVQRWIKTGKLQGELVQTAYGPTWMLNADALEGAAQVMEVVKFERQTDPQTLAIAVAQAIQDA